MLRVLTLCGGVLILSSFWHTAAADPILITSGRLVADHSLAGVQLSSTMRDFTLNAGASVGAGVFDPLRCIGDCLPGQTQSLYATWSGSDFLGTATVDGTTFPLTGIQPTAGSAFVEFFGSWTAPPFTGATTATVMSPFTFKGTLFYPASPQLPFSEMLVGQGIATLHLDWSTAPVGGGWLFDRARYEFQSQPAPIPEPATMLLVGSGLAGIAAVRRRRRQPDVGSE